MKNIYIGQKALLYILIGFVLLFSVGGYLDFRNQQKLSYSYIYNGIFIEGMNVSGMSKSQALKKVKSYFEENFNPDSLTLIYREKKWVIKLSSIEYSLDFNMAVNNAYALGREENKNLRLRTMKSLEKNPVNLVVSGKYDTQKLRNFLVKIKKQVDFSCKSSTYDYNYGRIMYTSEIEGRNFDIDANIRLIEQYLLNRNFNPVNLEVSAVKPPITLADVKDIKDTLASFTTTFNKNNSNRAHNIEVAAKKINNYLLKPGAEFSMNTVLGPRTSSNGYMQAPILYRNTVVPGSGGGICQVATTLYNSVLLSMLQVTSRVHHSAPIAYVSPGMDATISEGYIDLKFKNNRDYTVCIVTLIQANQVTVKIIGKKYENNPIVRLKPVIVSEYDIPSPEMVIDNSLADYEKKIIVKGRKGLKVSVYREQYNQNGDLIKSEKISEDLYKPLRGKIAVNQKTYDLYKLN